MKKWIVLVAVVGAVGIACGVSEQPINITDAHPLKDDCTIDTNHYISSGSLNLGERLDYQAYFTWSSDVLTTDISVDGTATDSARNDFYGSEADISYTSTPDLGLPSTVVPGLWVLPANSDPTSQFIVDLIPPDIGKAAAAKLATLSGGEATVFATLKLKGKLGSGSAVETNAVTFPIDVFSAPFPGCPTGQVATVPDGVCPVLVGQNGVELGCADAGS